MRRSLCCVSLLVFTAALLGQEPAQELGKLKGLWTLESRSSGGTEFKQAKALMFQLRIEGDQWTPLVKGKDTGADKIVVDPTKTPKTIDRLSDGGKSVTRGIYKLDGDTLTVAFSPTNNADRPTAFESVKGSPTILSVYKRTK